MEKRLSRILSVAVGVAVLVSLFLAVKASTMTIPSSEETAGKKLCVQTVKIERGDSIWALAKEYYTEDWGDMRDFVEQIKKSNNLSSDEIHAGNYIVIPHY